MAAVKSVCQFHGEMFEASFWCQIRSKVAGSVAGLTRSPCGTLTCQVTQLFCFVSNNCLKTPTPIDVMSISWKGSIAETEQ